MPKISIHHNGSIKTINYIPEKSLQNILQKEGISLFAPCGGNGTCGKCKVLVKNVGSVLSCKYKPIEDIEVFLPDSKESNILVSQYEYTLQLPYTPDTSAKLANTPIGVAIDIGTTSLAFYFIDLNSSSLIHTKGIENPQTKYGADVISRITYCSNPNGLSEIQNSLIQEINNQFSIITSYLNTGIESITKVSISGNTTMLHILLGVDPTSIALAPFKPKFTSAMNMKCNQIGLLTHPEALLHTLPSISAFVGADIVAGLASLAPKEDIKNYFFIDIGTNGEMALVTKDKIWCCATAAGPAFEGANIACGMGAFEGAISTYNTNKYATIGDKKPIGICGSGLLDIIASLIETGKIGSDGLLETDFIVAEKEESDIDSNIVITPQDIREVQLAKSAIATGVNILAEKAELPLSQIDALFLAGGFGNFMNPESAINIGLLPKEFKGKIIPIGNSSGAGAMLDVLSVKFNDYVNAIIEKSEHIDLSTHENFELSFAMNMYF